MADIDSNFDFGFSIVDEEELDVLQQAKSELITASSTAESLEDRLHKMYNMVVPLLNNLKASPEKDHIHWPGELRVKRIEEFEDRLLELMEL